MSNKLMLIPSKLHSFRNFVTQIYKNYATWNLCFLLFVNDSCGFGKNG
ncbi:hypothetical protein JN06_02070 [Bacteroides zoogleoformans]|nr:hypothetical protein JN06_02070 [Bacteroides zoogleoformans]